jgi:ribose transport system permease protein
MAVSDVRSLPQNVASAIANTIREPAFWGNNAAVIGLAIVCVVFSILSPFFLTWGNISDLLVSASLLIVLALAQQLAIVVGGIDLSIASSLPLAGVIFGLALVGGLSVPLAILLTILVAMIVGFLNGVLITMLKVNDFIVTLGMFSVIGGVTLIACGGQSFGVNSGFLRGLALGGIGSLRYFYLIALFFAIVTHVLFFHTRLGTHILATGGNREAARNMGIRVNRLRVIAYTIDGALVGVAAILLVARTGGSDPSLQTSNLLSSIAAVVLGGGSLFGGRAVVAGAVAGALLLSTLLNGFTLLQISEYYQPIAVGIVVVAAAVLSRLQQ